MGLLAITLLTITAITFILAYLLFRFIKPGKNHLKNPAYWITSAFLTPVMFALILFIWFKVSSSYPELEFDKLEWADNSETRYQYADDLVDNDKLVGLNKTEVIQLLGEASAENDSMLTYYIGYSPKYFFNSDPDWLEIGFQDEIAINSKIIQ